MVSAIDLTKRPFVSLLLKLALAYNVGLTLTRDSAEKDVRSADRKLSRKADPAPGGTLGAPTNAS